MQLRNGSYRDRWLVPLYETTYDISPIINNQSRFIIHSHPKEYTNVSPEIESEEKEIEYFNRKLYPFTRSDGLPYNLGKSLKNAYLLRVSSRRVYVSKRYCVDDDFDEFVLKKLEKVPENHVIWMYEVEDYTPMIQYLDQVKTRKVQELTIEEKEKGILMKIDQEVILENFNEWSLGFRGFKEILENPDFSHILFSEEEPTIISWTDFEDDNIRFNALEYVGELAIYLKPFLVSRENLKNIQERIEKGEFKP